MATLTLPRIYLGKRKPRSQMCDIHTLDRRIRRIELDVVRSCASDPMQNMAFLLDGGNQYFDTKTKEWIQVLWELSLYPVCSVVERDKEETKKLLLQIYREAKKQAKAEQYKKMGQGSTPPLVWIVSIFCATMIIIAGIVWFGS